MSIRTNPMKAVPSLQRRLKSVKSTEKVSNIAEKLDKLMSELNNIEDLFSTVKRNEDELLDTLKLVDDLLRNFRTKKFGDICHRLLDSDNVAKSNQEKGNDNTSSSQKAQDNKSVRKDAQIDVKLKSLMSEIHKMKEMFSTVKDNQVFSDALRAVEDFLQNFNEESFAEIAKLPEDANQSHHTKGNDKTSSSQEAQDNKSVGKDAQIDVKLKSLMSELHKMKGMFSTVKDALRAMEDFLQNFIAESFVESAKLAEDANQSHHTKGLPPRETSREDKVDQVLRAIGQKISDSTKKLGVSQSETKASDSPGQGKASKTVQYPPLSLSHDHEGTNLVLKRFQASYEALDVHSKLCCLSLSVFPENVVINKRHIIYWWIGEGFVKNTTERKTAEEEGEDVFDELLNSNIIVAHGNGKCPVVNKFKINPWIRHMLVSSVLGENKQPFGIYSQVITSSHHHDSADACLILDQQKVKISGQFDPKFDHWRSVFNVGASYLDVEPQWMAKMKKLVVLQLGRWQESPSHHIEVGNADFMKDLKAQKYLKYLSLRGISRIFELPPSIAQLVSLQILDLKACHNLETLPNEIVSLRKLTHLDVSQCYLLESMPKGIEKLIELQVLKGFVVGNSSKTPRIPDLAKLEKLKRLSIHIGSEAMIQDGEFQSLQELKAVKCLKISWGVLSNTMYKDIEIFLPLGLEKLQLEGFPSEKIPEWLKPHMLPHRLKKLYIKGGKLTSLGHETKGSFMTSSVEIVRLRYLKYLKVDPNLREMFPCLKYAERKQVLQRSYEWSIEEGESSSKS
ncbi:Disease resistance RPP13-like protein 4, partial [Mucuna pruriens]